MDKGSFSYISIPHGKDCWGSATAHFECLDHYPGKYDNHKACAETNSAWLSSCPGYLRTSQLVHRQLKKDTEKLYKNQVQLDNYNKRKNEHLSFWKAHRTQQ